MVEEKTQTKGAMDPDTLTSVSKLGMLLKAMGRRDEALPLYQRALAGREAKLGAMHPQTFESMNNLGALGLVGGWAIIVPLGLRGVRALSCCCSGIYKAPFMSALMTTCTRSASCSRR